MKLNHRTTALLLLLGACAFGHTAQAQTPRPEPAVPDPAMVRALAGCYALDLGAWSRPPGREPAQPTTLVRLDTLRRHAGEPRGGFVAVRLSPTDAAPPSGRPPAVQLLPAGWSLVPPDSVEIIPWSTGFAAEVFSGRVVDAGLRGVVRRTSDALPVDAAGNLVLDAFPTAPARGRRVPCQPA